MAKNLVIVESPAKAKTISKYLGNDFTIKASMGHIIDLPVKELGIDIEKGFKPKYIVIPGKKKIIEDLKSAAKSVDNIYLAPDPDREGEAIAWHIAESVKKSCKQIYRVMFNEITKKAVLNAIEHPHEIDMNKVNAQQARRLLDRLVGYKVSPFLWKAICRGLSAGRVQSVALRLICEREGEIRKFVPKEYWSLEAMLAKENGTQFIAKLFKINNEKAEIDNGARTKEIIELLKGKKFIVDSIEREEQRRFANPPFITSSIQQEAARKLRFSAAKTMQIAQQLYEGLDINGQSTGLITYMRTDSFRIADEARKAAEDYITSEFGNNYLPKQPNKFKQSKNAQDAHEAIRPANVDPQFSPDSIKNSLTSDQYRLYTLIWKRFFSSLMSPAVFDSTVIIIKSEGHLFKTTGSVPKFDGFMRLYIETEEEEKDAITEPGENILPELNEGELLVEKGFTDKQHFTQPPAPYSEASLVKDLEIKGIGRPSTYAQIIDTIKKRKYVQLDKNRFHPTPLGEIVSQMLLERFPTIFDIQFTANMENNLDLIEEGKANWVETLETFWASLEKLIASATAESKDLKKSLQEDTGQKCEKCGRKMVIKWGRNGRFIACEDFPKCHNTKPIDNKQPDEKIDVKCELCGNPMVIKRSQRGRFLGCSTYPACRNTKPFSIGVPCPREGCPGEVTERYSKRGRIFYSCNQYPKCNFASWSKPVKNSCPTCGNSYMVEKITKAQGKSYYCPKCKSKVSIEEPSPVADE